MIGEDVMSDDIYLELVKDVTIIDDIKDKRYVDAAKTRWSQPSKTDYKGNHNNLCWKLPLKSC